MDLFTNIASALANNLFSQVAVLIGLIALIGLLLQRKPLEQVVGGAIRATLGVVILNIGVDIFVAGLVAFQAIVSSAFKITPPASTSSMKTFLEGKGAVVPLVIALGFLIHLILVALFKSARYVYLTGHLMYWMSLVLVATLVEASPGADPVVLTVVASVVVACYWTLQPLWMEPLMKRAVGGDNFGLGHTTSSLALLSGYGAKALRLGDPVKHDTEKIRMPKAISFLKDINVSTVFVIGIIMIVTILFAESDVVTTQMGDSTMAPMMWGFVQALRFAAGIAVLLYGVRMFRGGDRAGLPRHLAEAPSGFPTRPGYSHSLPEGSHSGHDRIPGLDSHIPGVHGCLCGNRLVCARAAHDHAVLRWWRSRGFRQCHSGLAWCRLRRNAQWPDPVLRAVDRMGLV